jgi:hypothetical protein
MHLGQMAAEQPAKAAVIMAGTGQRVTFAELNAAAASRPRPSCSRRR